MNDDSNEDSYADAIQNTEDFLDHLLRAPIPTANSKQIKNADFRKNQAARMELINERRNKRQKEAQVQSNFRNSFHNLANFL